jgi:hypothetical protein
MNIKDVAGDNLRVSFLHDSNKLAPTLHPGIQSQPG